MTEHKGYYEKTGWEFFEIAPLGRNETNRIYKKFCNNNFL